MNFIHNFPTRQDFILVYLKEKQNKKGLERVLFIKMEFATLYIFGDNARWSRLDESILANLCFWRPVYT